MAKEIGVRPGWRSGTCYPWQRFYAALGVETRDGNTQSELLGSCQAGKPAQEFRGRVAFIITFPGLPSDEELHDITGTERCQVQIVELQYWVEGFHQKTCKETV